MTKKGGSSRLPEPNAVAGNAARAASYGVTDAILGAIPFSAGPLGGVASGIVGSLLTDLVGDPLANGLGGMFGGQQETADDGHAGAVQMRGSGMFGGFDNMTPERYNTVMNLIAAATAGAGQSNSPIAAFLAPVVGSMVSASAERGLDAYSAQSAEALLGRPLTPQEQQAAAIAADDNAPDYLKTIARSMLPTATGGGSPRTGTARRRSPAAPSAPRPTKLTYIERDADGIYRGYNPATGKREVVPNADTVATTGQPVIPPPPADPVLPRDPGSLPPGGEDLSGLSDEDLLSRYR